MAISAVPPDNPLYVQKEQQIKAEALERVQFWREWNVGAVGWLGALYWPARVGMRCTEQLHEMSLFVTESNPRQLENGSYWYPRNDRDWLLPVGLDNPSDQPTTGVPSSAGEAAHRPHGDAMLLITSGCERRLFPEPSPHCTTAKAESRRSRPHRTLTVLAAEASH